MPWYGYHSYLNDFIKENKCRKIMEIGVYNGENALSLVNSAAQVYPFNEVEYYGFDFFYYYSKDTISNKLRKTGCRYKLYEGDTLETLPKFIKSLPSMDLIFIDGGKSYTVAKSDWEHSRTLMHGKTGVFVHNIGFQGVGRMVNSISLLDYTVEKFYAPSEGRVALIMRK